MFLRELRVFAVISRSGIYRLAALCYNAPMRYFNTHGPVNAQEHYIVERRALVEQLSAQIQQGKYFTIYAPRQMGKTTLLRAIDAVLDAQADYLSIDLSFELYESWSVADFWADFGERIAYHISTVLTTKLQAQSAAVRTLLGAEIIVDSRSFLRFCRQLYTIAPTLKLVLVIDEFDATPQEVLTPLLQTWRTMYLDKQPPHSLHSVVLVGIQNIARLNVGRSSPFNIAYQHQLEPFTLAEVEELLAQYTAETGQGIANGVIEKLYVQSAGQPFLVNRVAALLTQTVDAERTQPITREALDNALQMVVRESNYNFETIQRQATPYGDDVLKIIFGAEYPFTLNDALIKGLYLFGIIRETAAGMAEMANPLYKRILLDYFRPRQIGVQGAILANGHDFRPYVVDGLLQVNLLLTRFREFIERRGREAFKVTPMPQEATGQYLLMAYLDIVVRQIGGDLYTEVNSGEGRLDLIISHQGRRYIIETKIWRGQVYYEEGLTQLATYLQTEGQLSGYYVLFHARPTVYGQLPHDKLEFTTQIADKTLHVFLIRLGHLFSADSSDPI